MDSVSLSPSSMRHAGAGQTGARRCSKNLGGGEAAGRNLSGNCYRLRVPRSAGYGFSWLVTPSAFFSAC